MQDSGWQTVQVPGARKASESAGADGIAWYRTWVRVHDSFFTRHERNLYEESVGVNVRDTVDRGTVCRISPDDIHFSFMRSSTSVVECHW